MASFFPETEVVLEWRSFEPSIVKSKYCADTLDLYDGRAGLYTCTFLVDWRVWIGNPSIKTMLSIPWLKQEEVSNYNRIFITDEKIKKHLKKISYFSLRFLNLDFMTIIVTKYKTL